MTQFSKMTIECQIFVSVSQTQTSAIAIGAKIQPLTIEKSITEGKRCDTFL